MDIQAQVVAGAVHEVALQFTLFLDDLQVLHPLHDHVPRGVVGGAERLACPHLGDARFLGGQHQIVDGPLVRREFPAGRHGTRHVRGVAVVFCTDVAHQQVASHQGAAVGNVVQHATVRPTALDAGKAFVLCTVGLEDEFHDGLGLVLGHVRLQLPHELFLGLAGDLDGTAHERELLSLFQLT